eukprot:78349-Alexandrium_andersonii.AAC.1
MARRRWQGRRARRAAGGVAVARGRRRAQARWRSFARMRTGRVRICAGQGRGCKRGVLGGWQSRR